MSLRRRRLRGEPLPMLDGSRLPPASGGAASSLVVLLHGYGSNGADLISLAPLWQPLLPDTAFVAPNAPERCPGMHGGYQWWSLSTFDRPSLARGVRRAAPALDAFIDAERTAAGVGNAKVLLVGFSQGTMMALHVGLRRAAPPAGIIGFSGMVADPVLSEAEITSRPPVLLLHGDADPIVPVSGSREAERELHRLGLDVSLHIAHGLGHGVDQGGIEAAGCFAEKVLRARQGGQFRSVAATA